jgi:hypothetical protein
MNWKVTAVVLSALWLIAVLGYELWERAEKNELYARAIYGFCVVSEDRRVKEEKPETANYAQCSKDREQALSEANKAPIDWRPLALYGLVPLPFLWLGTFLLQASRPQSAPMNLASQKVVLSFTP